MNSLRRPGRALEVTRAIDRIEHLLGEPPRFLEDGVGHLGGIVAALRRGGDRRFADQLVENEAQVPKRCVVHPGSSCNPQIY